MMSSRRHMYKLLFHKNANCVSYCILVNDICDLVYHLILCSEDTCYHSTVSLLRLMSLLPASLTFLHCPSIGFHQALSITSALDSLQKIFSQESPRGLGPAVLLPLQITCYLPSNKSARLMVSAGLLEVWLQN